MLGSYSAEMSEQKDMLCVKHLNRKVQLCPICHVIKEDLKNCNMGEASTANETRSALNYYEAVLSTEIVLRFIRPSAVRSIKEIEKRKLYSLSAHPIMAVFCDFRFVGATTYLDFYSLFSVGQMRAFHLGTYMVLKNAAT